MGSMRAVAVPRAGSGPFSPVYQLTVSVDVPATSAVALLNAGPTTRCGGLPKKSLLAATADAAVSEVSASLSTAAVSAACRLSAVKSELGAMVNSFGPGVADVVAVSVMDSLVPSGRLKRNWMVSPSFGLVTRSTEATAGDPAGPVTVAPASVEVTLASLKPNGDTASSATCTDVSVVPVISRRP